MGPPSSSPGDPRYRARVPGRNPNLSDRPPWREFSIVAGVVVGIALVVYLILGWLAGVVATRIPPATEQRWGDLLTGTMPFPTDFDHPARLPLQELADQLALPVADRAPRLVVHVVPGSTVNAAALPGGHILVFEGLLADVASQNELAMILAHEVAHHVHRDHLRQMGRSLLVLVASHVLLGPDSLTGQLLTGSADLLDLRYSRGQEAAADRLALRLLAEHYGHVGGSLDFFERHVDSDAPALRFLQSHPLSRDRVQRLREEARTEGYPWGDPAPLPAWARPPEG